MNRDSLCGGGCYNCSFQTFKIVFVDSQTVIKQHKKCGKFSMYDLDTGQWKNIDDDEYYEFINI